MAEELSVKHKKFADEWIIDSNQTRAYKVAYPNVKTDQVAATNANRLLKNAKIAAYIAERMKPDDEKRVATGDEVLEFYTKVMNGEITDAFGLDASLSDRLKAADGLAKRHGLNKINVEMTDNYADTLKAARERGKNAK